MSEGFASQAQNVGRALHKQLSGLPTHMELEDLHRSASGSTSGSETDLAALHADAQANGGAAKAAPAPAGTKLRRSTPQRMVLRDKLGFFLGVINICLSAYWLGRSPHTYYRWFIVKAIVLYTSRFFMYKPKNLHYYMLEWCYVANAALAIHLVFFPRSAWLHKMVFAQVAGTLTCAIPATRNSLVLHSLDKITSLFMHISPALVVWAHKWYPNRELLQFDKMSAAERHEWEHASWWELGVVPMVPYLVWMVLYYFKIFVLSAAKIRERGYQTLYTYTLRNQNSGPARLVLSAPKALQPLVYMGMHFFMTWFSVLTAKLWWSSFWAHTIFLILCGSVSVWNGASYYFDIFAHKYVTSMGIERRAPTKSE